MRDVLSGIILIWLAMSIYAVAGIIDEKAEECGGVVTKEYVEDLIHSSIYLPFGFFIDFDNVEDTIDSCYMVIKND